MCRDKRAREGPSCAALLRGRLRGLGQFALRAQCLMEGRKPRVAHPHLLTLRGAMPRARAERPNTILKEARGATSGNKGVGRGSSSCISEVDC